MCGTESTRAWCSVIPCIFESPSPRLSSRRAIRGAIRAVTMS